MRSRSAAPDLEGKLPTALCGGVPPQDLTDELIDANALRTRFLHGVTPNIFLQVYRQIQPDPRSIEFTALGFREIVLFPH
jgi:hypothetical protein